MSRLWRTSIWNEFGKEMKSRGVNAIRHTGYIVVLAKSKRAANRLLEYCRKILGEQIETPDEYAEK